MLPPDNHSSLRRTAAILSFVGIGFMVVPSLVYVVSSILTLFASQTIAGSSPVAYTLTSHLSLYQTLFTLFVLEGIGVLLFVVSAFMRLTTIPRGGLRAMSAMLVLVTSLIFVGGFVAVLFILFSRTGSVTHTAPTVQVQNNIKAF